MQIFWGLPPTCSEKGFQEATISCQVGTLPSPKCPPNFGFRIWFPQFLSSVSQKNAPKKLSNVTVVGCRNCRRHTFLPTLMVPRWLPGDQKSKDEAFGLIAGPNTPEGRRICVFGVGVSLPAAAQDHLANYWCGIAAGTDGGSELSFWVKNLFVWFFRGFCFLAKGSLEFILLNPPFFGGRGKESISDFMLTLLFLSDVTWVIHPCSLTGSAPENRYDNPFLLGSFVTFQARVVIPLEN